MAARGVHILPRRPVPRPVGRGAPLAHDHEDHDRGEHDGQHDHEREHQLSLTRPHACRGKLLPPRRDRSRGCSQAPMKRPPRHPPESRLLATGAHMTALVVARGLLDALAGLALAEQTSRCHRRCERLGRRRPAAGVLAHGGSSIMREIVCARVVQRNASRGRDAGDLRAVSWAVSGGQPKLSGRDMIECLRSRQQAVDHPSKELVGA
jgi:hypothetical protein